MAGNSVSLQGGSSATEVVFEASAGTWSDGPTGCDGSRAVAYGSESVTFNPPADGVYSIQAVYASAQGAVSVVTLQGGSCLQADINNDGIVDVNDLLLVLAQYGQVGDNIAADLDNSGLVAVDDLLLLLAG